MTSNLRQGLHHRYLVIKDDDNIKDCGYRVRMITENRINGFADCSTENVNGRYIYKYLIPDEYISAGAYVERFHASGEFIRILLSALFAAAGELYRYLLEPDGILTELENIFILPGNGDILFCYCPCQTEDFDEKCRHLSEELIHFLDHNDKEAVEKGYGFYKLCASGSVTAEKISRLLYMDTEKNRQPLNEPFIDDKPVDDDDEVTGILNEEDERGRYDFLFETPKDKKTSERPGIFKRLKKLFSGGRDKKNKRNKKYAENDIMPDAGLYKDYRDLDKTELLTDEDPNETVLLERKENVSVRAWLVPQNDFKTESIPLKKDGYMIGKDVSDEDIRIDGQTVSRYHARLSWENNSYTITDLASKNGTAVNNRRLSPGEECLLSDRDEIMLADKCFIYSRVTVLDVANKNNRVYT